ncbi:hypothetical protein PSTT_13171 [Puccinia striiformis]|uniref:Uncharacterized protein n=1 Tax=Puccinia striiformis TaxID=27350 RepID=A0A2S4UST4_9BASI|nr:hypothetical protein PSTT_13171 [Puccinia striiformis]
MKYLLRAFYIINDFVRENNIKIKWTSIISQQADIFTKKLGPNEIEEAVVRLGLRWILENLVAKGTEDYRDRSTSPEGPLVKQTDPDNDLPVGLLSALPQLKQQIDAIVELFELAELLKDQHSKTSSSWISSEILIGHWTKSSLVRLVSSVQQRQRYNPESMTSTSKLSKPIDSTAYIFTSHLLSILSPIQCHSTEDRESMLGDRLRLLPPIESSIICASGTEFEIIQDQWEDHTSSCHEHARSKRTSRLSTPHQTGNSAWQLTFTSHEAFKSISQQILKSILQQFFRATNGQKTIPNIYSHEFCHSDQLNIVGELAENIASQSGGMVCDNLRDLSNKAEEGGDNEYLGRLVEDAEKLEKYFGARLLLILIHFLPIIPDSDGFDTQNYYKDWLFVWHSQLTLAINNFMQACRGFERTTQQFFFFFILLTVLYVKVICKPFDIAGKKNRN